MYCIHCGFPMEKQGEPCPRCGQSQNGDISYCPTCAARINHGQTFCPSCGTRVSSSNGTNEYKNSYQQNYSNQYFNGCGYTPYQPIYPHKQKSKIAAGLLGIFLGGLGIHNFYLGYTGKAVTQIILTILSCSIAGIWGFIKGILILCGQINTDADGVPLAD